MQQHISSSTHPIDPISEQLLQKINEEQRVRANRIPGVRTVLVVLSPTGMVYDTEALKHKLMESYPECAVFFEDSMGFSLGAAAPQQIDLLIDFTPPDYPGGILRTRRLRRIARVAIGRNAGLLRKRLFDRVLDEKAKNLGAPEDKMLRERFIQKRIMGMAGVVFSHSGETPIDHSKNLARTLSHF